jgi:hypothetical protein
VRALLVVLVDEGVEQCLQVGDRRRGRVLPGSAFGRLRDQIAAVRS